MLAFSLRFWCCPFIGHTTETQPAFGIKMLFSRRAQWIVLLFFFERASLSCVQQNIRINGESETSLPTKSSAQCEEECSRKRCPSWTWEGGQCQLKRRGKEGRNGGKGGEECQGKERGQMVKRDKKTRREIEERRLGQWSILSSPNHIGCFIFG